jgi:hypothetical protein
VLQIVGEIKNAGDLVGAPRGARNVRSALTRPARLPLAAKETEASTLFRDIKARLSVLRSVNLAYAAGRRWAQGFHWVRNEFPLSESLKMSTSHTRAEHFAADCA